MLSIFKNITLYSVSNKKNATKKPHVVLFKGASWRCVVGPSVHPFVLPSSANNTKTIHFFYGYFFSIYFENVSLFLLVKLFFSTQWSVFTFVARNFFWLLNWLRMRGDVMPATAVVVVVVVVIIAELFGWVNLFYMRTAAGERVFVFLFVFDIVCFSIPPSFSR